MSLRIIGFSDVITNSSSEVYTIYTKDGCERIKEIVNAILELSNSKYRFDDLFTIDFDVDTEYIRSEYFSWSKSITDEDIVNFAFHHDEEECGSPLVKGISIRAKDPKNIRVANILNEFDNIFEAREVYS